MNKVSQRSVYWLFIILNVGESKKCALMFIFICYICLQSISTVYCLKWAWVAQWMQNSPPKLKVVGSIPEDPSINWVVTWLWSFVKHLGQQKICVVQVTLPKKLGQVGTQGFFLAEGCSKYGRALCLCFYSVDYSVSINHFQYCTVVVGESFRTLCISQH